MKSPRFVPFPGPRNRSYLMLIYFLVLFILVIVNEALVEVVIKSEIFRPIRDFISKGGSFFRQLFSCGYCFSFWTALLLVTAAPVAVLPVSGFVSVNALLTVLVVQRLSNVLHNIIDKGTDKYYSLAHVNSEKE